MKAKHFKYTFDLPNHQRLVFYQNKPRRIHIGGGKFLVTAIIRSHDRKRLFHAVVLIDAKDKNKQLDVFFLRNFEIIRLNDQNMLAKLGMRAYGDMFPYNYKLTA